MTAPAISALMTVYNGLPYIEEALRSIMEQTFTDIEIIVVDDASTDETSDVLARLAEEDSRIRILTLTENAGPYGAANRGLEAARAPLIARMDADDIAHPDRLAIQKTYMDANPDVVLLSASVRKITAEGTPFATDVRNYDDARVRWIAAFSMPLYHPCYVFRRETGGRRLTYSNRPIAQDYDFCTAALEHGRVVSLGDVVLDYRVHGGSISVQKRTRQDDAGRVIAEEFQIRTMEAPLQAALAPVLDGFYAPDKPLDTGAVIHGLRRHIAAQSGLTRWMRGYSVLVLVYLMRLRGAGKGMILKTLLRHCPDFLFAAALFRVTKMSDRKKFAP